MALLESLASMLAIDIAQIEALHSTNRETTMMRSRGWFCSAATLSSRFITHVVSKSELQVPTQKNQESEKSKDSKPKPTGLTHGGGPWKAFVHDRAKGQKLNADLMSRLSDEFRALTPDQFQKYKEAGAAGTLAHQRGFSSFGPRDPKRSRTSTIPKALLPGDIDPLTGTVVGAMPSSSSSSNTTIEALTEAGNLGIVPYSGPDFFAENYEKLKREANEETQTLYQLDKLSKDQESHLSLFESEASSDKFLASWTTDKFSSLLSGFRKRGTNCSDLASFQWTPPLSNLVKAGGNDKGCFNHSITHSGLKSRLECWVI